MDSLVIKRIKLDNDDDDDDDKINFETDLIAQFCGICLMPEIKKQQVYLSPRDENIVFNEAKHVYYLENVQKQFSTSVTGYCKDYIHHSEFNAVELIRKLKVDILEDKFDMHIFKLVEWKYASVFGSLFHAIIEFYFEHVVNKCSHQLCKKQYYNHIAYWDLLIDETNNYNLECNILSQSLIPHTKMNVSPVMPCLYAVQRFDIYMKTILNIDNFNKFIQNNPAYCMENEKYCADIRRTIEDAFGVNSLKCLTKAIVDYRKHFEEMDGDYANTVYRMTQFDFGVGKMLTDLECHLGQFKKLLIHLPLSDVCDIRPEYIVYSQYHGLAGSVDLTMRMRENPKHLLIYDWKTCKKIFTTFWNKSKEQTNQLLSYSCQLHTYSNIITESNSEYDIDLFVVNITCDDFCMYNVKNVQNCKCKEIYSSCKIDLKNITNK